MSTARILIAEDEAHIREGLITTLESENYEVTAVADGEAALNAADQASFQLIILDVMMPKKSGYDVCREIRARDPLQPILLLTAKSEEIDKVVGLKLGADDYVTKPFGIHELLARVEALIRRGNLQGQSDVEEDREPFQFGDWQVEPKLLRAVRGDQQIDISQRELNLLRLFAQAPDEVLDREHLLQEAWGQSYMGTTRTLDQHIAQLRKKIEDEPARPKLIITVHGVGYRHPR